jgi:hypothetical protein
VLKVDEMEVKAEEEEEVVVVVVAFERNENVIPVHDVVFENSS